MLQRLDEGLSVGLGGVEDVATVRVDAGGTAEGVLLRVQSVLGEVLRDDLCERTRESRVVIKALAAREVLHPALLRHLAGKGTITMPSTTTTNGDDEILMMMLTWLISLSISNSVSM